MDHGILLTSTFNKTKFNWRSPSMDRGSVDKFTAANSSWSSGNMYRTSYRDMSVKVSKDHKANDCTVFRIKPLSRPMPFLSMLVLFQARTETLSWDELSPKLPEDASIRRTSSKRLIQDGRATGKSICHSLISL